MTRKYCRKKTTRKYFEFDGKKYWYCRRQAGWRAFLTRKQTIQNLLKQLFLLTMTIEKCSIKSVFMIIFSISDFSERSAAVNLAW
jgi:hypothetical protein